MENNNKIREFIESHREFLKVNNIDIAYSDISNEWFVYYRDRRYNVYEFFIKFETVEQLVDIILQEVEFKLRCTIEEACATPECEAESISDQIEEYSKQMPPAHDLEASIVFLKEKGLADKSMFFEGLIELLQTKIESRIK
ncbi:MAG: hypothetical protein E7260_11040 [Lachnospiraceae bacterium]|nr:hypothetical protein [Lachnospiraceae bacterium]